MCFNAKKCHILNISWKRQKPCLYYQLGQEALLVVDSYPYLGITISSDLRWHEHINNISAKATRTLNFVRRNIYSCPPEAKALAYTSLVRPHLEYASAAWDPFTVRDITQLDKVQRRSARFAKHNYKWSHSVSQLTSELGWQPLDQRRRNARLTLFYKSIHCANSIPVHHLRQPTRHTRQRGTHTFTSLSSRTNVYKYLYFPRTVVDWNALPDSAHLAPSTDSFRAALHRISTSPSNSHC